MISYMVKRLLQALLVLLGGMTLVFFLQHLSGDPTQLLLPLDATAAERAAFRARMGFNDPLPLQYIRFAFDVISGNLGFSYRHSAPAVHLVLERLPATFQLTGSALLADTCLRSTVPGVRRVQPGP